MSCNHQAKICITCGKEKPIKDYYKRKISKDGHDNKCKKCKNEYSKLYHERNKDKLNAKSRDYYKKYYQENIDKVKKYNKKYRIKNAKKEAEQKRIYYIENKEKIDKRNINYYYNNWAERRKKIDQYDKEHKNDLWKKKLIQKKERRKKDPVYNFIQHTRGRINQKIRCKQERSEELLGCTFLDAYEYLENMGFNSAKHHIDHIVPLSRFNIDDSTHRLVMFHYSNLQPLIPSENIKKQNNLEQHWILTIINICIHRKLDSDPIINYIRDAA